MANNFSIFHNSFDWTVLIILAAGMLFFSKRNFLDINLTVAKFNLDFRKKKKTFHDHAILFE